MNLPPNSKTGTLAMISTYLFVLPCISSISPAEVTPSETVSTRSGQRKWVIRRGLGAGSHTSPVGDEAPITVGEGVHIVPGPRWQSSS